MMCSYVVSKPLERSKYDLMPVQALFKSIFAGQKADPEVRSDFLLPVPSLTWSAYHVFRRL